MITFLIDLNKLEVIKTTDCKEAVRQLEYWAEILIPKSDFYIGDDLNSFTPSELMWLYKNMAKTDFLKDISKIIDQGDNQRAKNLLQKALRSTKFSPDAHFLIARVYET